MDPLTQLVALLRPRALLWKQMIATGEWAVRFPPNDGVAFCVVARGRAVFQARGRAPMVLGAGDFLLLTAPPAWTLGSSETAVPANYATVYAGAHAPATHVGQGTTGPGARVLGGRFAFDHANAALLEGVLPAIVAVHAPDPGAARLRAVLDLVGDEASADRPGRTLVLDRLLEILLIEAIRHGDRHAADQRGLLAGLADPQIGAAIRALHADARRPWTLAQLAALAGMSRSVFADRFGRLLGVPPIAYLLRWRMAMAKDALRSGEARVSDVAFACGYQSVHAFSAAFRRVVGCPPSQYAPRGGPAREPLAAAWHTAALASARTGP